MEKLRAITTVYSYYLPEVRSLVSDLTRQFPHDVFLRSIRPGLDDFHQPIIDKLVARHQHDVPALGSFPHRYPTSGSEEGIREYLTHLQLQGVRSLYVWEGDYEGYREVARTRGLQAIEVPFDQDPRSLAPGYWFLSNPSARDGMILHRDKIDRVLEAGHKVFYDLSYLSATQPATFDLSHPNILAAVVSFSKPYGLFYYRVGFTFSKEPIPSLYANKWFKNVFGLLVAETILDKLDLAAAAARYKRIQAEIVAAMRDELGLPIQTSDAYLLAHLPAAAVSPAQPAQLERFKRAGSYRFCLTPYFLEREQPA